MQEAWHGVRDLDNPEVGARRIENQPQNVLTAFEILLEEVEAEIDFVNSVGSRGFETRDYDRAQDALTRAGMLTAFRDRLASMRKEWMELDRAGEAHEDPASRTARRNIGKLRKGLRTPEESYYRPILESLVALGGKGRIGDVLDRVYKRMEKLLNEHDRQPLRSDPDMPRWRNAAQWARNSMVKEGLLRADSPRGEWEVTEQGRARLQSEMSQ